MTNDNVCIVDGPKSLVEHQPKSLVDLIILIIFKIECTFYNKERYNYFITAFFAIFQLIIVYKIDWF